MTGIQVADVRNFGVMGHTGSGKTTLVDALLYKLGLNDRLGSVEATDFVLHLRTPVSFYSKRS